MNEDSRGSKNFYEYPLRQNEIYFRSYHVEFEPRVFKNESVANVNNANMILPVSDTVLTRVVNDFLNGFLTYYENIPVENSLNRNVVMNTCMYVLFLERNFSDKNPSPHNVDKMVREVPGIDVDEKLACVIDYRENMVE